jgi:hypothetical protein
MVERLFRYYKTHMEEMDLHDIINMYLALFCVIWYLLNLGKTFGPYLTEDGAAAEFSMNYLHSSAPKFLLV